MFNDFERLANHSQDAIYHYDTHSRCFLFYNRQFETFFRLSSDVQAVISSDKVILSIHPEDRPRVLNTLRESLATGQRHGEVEYRLLYPDGSIRWLHDRWIVLRDETDTPCAIEGFIRDNTQNKLTELQFIQSKQNALIGSYIVRHGRFVYVNPEFIRITGFSEQELIGTESIKIVQEDYRDLVHTNAVAMIKGESLTPYEFCVVDKSGDTHWIMETVTPLIHEGKRATLGYFMDITELRKMQGNLSTLGLMVGTISHSLRGCLTGLNASLYLIESGFYRNQPAHIEEGLDVTKLMADRIRKLVLEVLYYSKKRDLQLEEVKVWQFAKEVAVHVENRIKAADIEFITDLATAPVTMVIDTEAIRSALINILENALEACIEDTRTIDHRIRFRTRIDDSWIYFTIADNGPGIDKEQAGKMFQLFGSTKGKRGTGIGLFVTRKAILKHGGKISFHSTANEGAEFRIALPRRKPLK
jgi:PAS domain S-box-containing protein